MVPKARPLPHGLVIIFEGIDGVGKTTQLELAQAELQKAGWPVTVTRNMGGTPIGEELRKVIKSPLERPPLTDFYISLAVQEPLLDFIDTARRQGKIILMDRGPLSLAAYQIYGTGVGQDFGWPHVEHGMDRIKPELILLYDMDPEAALERIASRNHDYFESKPLSYFQKVAEGFREAAKRYTNAVTIAASPEEQAIHKQTMDAIGQTLS